MNANNVDLYSKERVPLYTVIPLETPFTLCIEATSFCNMKCRYCLHSHTREKILQSGHIYEMMSDDTFGLILSQLQDFPAPIKTVNFAGVGEPLVHKKLPFFIRELKNSGRVEKITVISNGIALNKDLSDALIDAGLDDLRISLNGLSEEDYIRNCATKIDYPKFVDNIRYLYNSKKKMTLGIKILDSCFNEKEDEKKFFSMFGEMCDKIAVEKTVPLFDEVQYDNMIENDRNLSRYSLGNKCPVKICATPFFRMAVRSTGKLMICLPYNGLTTDNMDIRKQTMYQMWNGDEHRRILMDILKENKSDITEKCRHCFIKNDFAFKEDSLDDHVEELIKRIENNK